MNGELNPELMMLREILESDFAAHQLTSIFEFESLIDSLLLKAQETIASLIKFKIQAVKRCEISLRGLYIDQILESLQQMNREEKLTFFTKNEFKILNKTQGLLDLSALSLTEL